MADDDKDLEQECLAPQEREPDPPREPPDLTIDKAQLRIEQAQL